MKSGKAKALLRIAALFGVSYILLCAAVYAFQRSLLFFPSHAESTNLLKAWTDNGQVVGYCREVSNPACVWLMMHGNAGQASDREYALVHMSEDDALYVLEYPGYGTRHGSPSRKSIDKAASDAYRLLRQTYPTTTLCVVGESIGSGPAAMLAQERLPPEKIVLITPFDSLCNVASKRFWFLPVGLLLRDRWDNVKTLRNYDGQVDIFGATDDTVIPIDHARNLARAIPNSRLIEIPGGHNDWSFSTAVKITR